MKYLLIVLSVIFSSTFSFAGAPVVWNSGCGSGIFNLATQACLSSGGGSVTSVTASSPLASSGGATPNLTCQAASGSQPGCLASADFTTFNGAASATTAATSSNTASTIVKRDGSGDFSAGAVTLATPLSAASGGVGLPEKLMWVDQLRGDSFTADGTIGKPFPDLASFVAKVVANGDNNLYSYVAIVAPGNYGVLTLENSALYALVFNGMQGANLSQVKSTAANDNLASLVITGFGINGNAGKALNLLGASNNTNFCGGDCEFRGDTITGVNDTIQNANFLNFVGGTYKTVGTLTLTNISAIGTMAIDDFELSSSMSLISNCSLNVPDQFGGCTTGNGTFFLAEAGTSIFIPTINVDANSYYQNRSGVRAQSSGDSLSVNGYIDQYTINQRGNITLNAGSFYDDHGVVRDGTVTDNSSGGWTVYGKMSLAYLGLGAGMEQQTNVVLGLKDGHLKSLQTSVPTATVNANAGTGATCTVSHATDTAGQITLTTTAVSPASGEQCKVNFHSSYNTIPICLVSPIDANAGLVNATSHAYFPSTTGVVAIDYGIMDSAGHASNWSYYCIETQ